MAHVGEELGFGAIGSFRRGFGFTQAEFGTDFLGDVACRPAVAEKSPCRIEQWVAADRDHAFRGGSDLPRIDKVAERLVPIQPGIVLVPEPRIVRAFGGQLAARATDAIARVLTEHTDL